MGKASIINNDKGKNRQVSGCFLSSNLCSQCVVFFFRVAVLDKVTDFLLFLGKLLIVGIVGKWMVVPF